MHVDLQALDYVSKGTKSNAFMHNFVATGDEVVVCGSGWVDVIIHC